MRSGACIRVLPRLPGRTVRRAWRVFVGCGRMSKAGRYWILFVIVAVGLALSWGQVGHKTQRVLKTDPVVYLVAEQPCRPRMVPCAAIAGDRALVLGPDRNGLQLMQTGISVAEIAGVEVQFIGADAEPIGSSTLARRSNAWQLSQPPAAAATLRIRVIGNHETTVAEFPL